jgi:acetyl-CoA carboxylase carboxyltransferase component
MSRAEPEERLPSRPELEAASKASSSSSDRSLAERKVQQLRQRRAALEGDVQTRPRGARGRLESLFDQGSFVELDQFVTSRAIEFGMDELHVPGDGVVTGFGTIDGRQVAAYANDPTFLAGSLGEGTAEKIVKVQDLALRSRIPLVAIYESMGARSQEGVVALASCAAVLAQSARAQGVIPRISVIAGPCAGMAAQAAGLADFVFLISRQGRVLPRALEAARAIDGGGQELGSGKGDDIRSSLAHFVAEDEASCWAEIRHLLSYLPSSTGEPPPFRPTEDAPDRADLALQDLMPKERGHHYDVREIVGRLLDEGHFLEVQPHFAPNLLTGLGRLGGHTVGVVANQPQALDGALDTDACAKGARFVRLCDTFGIPLLTLVDTPGYVLDDDPGRTAREGTNLLHAYATATVPKLTVVTGRLYGESYAAMSPRQAGADLYLAWPSAEITIQPEEAVEFLFRQELESVPDPRHRRAELVANYAARFANPEVAAERGYVDAVVEPRETRRELSRALALCLRKRTEQLLRRHGNIPFNRG